jgi:hypothetical protein
MRHITHRIALPILTSSPFARERYSRRKRGIKRERSTPLGVHHRRTINPKGEHH